MTEVLPTSEPTPERSTTTLFSESIWLLDRFRAGDEQAATQLFERFAKRLSALVQSRLSKKLARRLDAEDVMLSAYRSFFVRARDGRFSIDKPGDLWRLLAQIALNKLYRSAEWNNAARRTTDRERGNILDIANRAIDASASPDLTVILADQLEHMMSQLTEATSRVLELRLQGHDVDEIAGLVGRSPRTVRRQLESIRAVFSKLAGSEDEHFETAEIRSDREHPPSQTLRVSLPEKLNLRDFVLRRQIGLGLTGRVYEAFDKRQQKLVAVKVLRKSLLADHSLREKFQAEAGIVSRLTHPGIVRIHGQGETPNGGWFIVMDLLPNGDLSQLTGQTLPVQQVVDWVRQVAVSIGYAHQQGVVHSDLKPANLLRSKEGLVVVTDFGFAQINESPKHRALCIAGTPAFMAPEQIDAAWGEVGPHTDIYGLGAVLFYLLTGKPPIVGRDLSDCLDQVASAVEVPEIISLRQDVPGWLVAVCQRSLRKSPRERFESLEEMLEALK